MLTLPVLLISLDNTVLGFAVPALSESLEPTSAQLLWIVDVYSFVLGGLLITMGNLGDRIGRRRLLLIGAFGFSIASTFAAFAPTANTLIAARAALGLAGATLMPSTLSLIRNIFTDPVQRQTAVAAWAAMFAVGGALGPIVGGFLLEHFWWGSVFLIGVPVTLILLVLGRAVLPESRDPNPGPFDLPSSALSLFTMFPAVYTMKKTAEDGLSTIVFVAAAVSVVAGYTFVTRQRRLKAPMIDMSLFRIPRFRSAVSANLVACFGFAGTMFVITQYLQLVVGMSPMRAGLQLLPGVAASIVCTMAAPRLAKTFGIFTTVAAGLTVSAIGFVLLSQLTAEGSVPKATLAVAVLSCGFRTDDDGGRRLDRDPGPEGQGRRGSVGLRDRRRARHRARHGRARQHHHGRLPGPAHLRARCARLRARARARDARCRDDHRRRARRRGRIGPARTRRSMRSPTGSPSRPSSRPS